MRLAYSANLGFLWTELPLPDAVRAAAKAGFDAVEMHWPYAVSASDLKAALDETGLPVVGINTVRGHVEAGGNGLSALPGREDEARAAIDQALAYAQAIGAQSVHVMAGKASGEEARKTFIDNLRYASDKAAPTGSTILVEALNPFDAPGYFLTDNATASAIIDEASRDNIRIMFDCYHSGRCGRPILEDFQAHRDKVGHVQFAAVPDRGEPDRGEVDFAALLPQIAASGHAGFFGAEYRPRAATDAGLGWLKAWRK